MTHDETPNVPYALDPSDFVVVEVAPNASTEGIVRALNAKGQPFHERTSYDAMCQGCCGDRVPMPMVLWRRFEPALDRFMWWFGPPPGAPKPVCPACKPRFGA